MNKLDRIRIASPCPVSWEHMKGNDRVRFCDQCQLNVYNLSSMSSIEAEALLVSTEGRLCARFYRRSDGTVLTKDCPVGLRALRRRVAQTAAAVFAIIGGLATMVSGQTKDSRKDSCEVQTSTLSKLEITNSSESIITGRILDPAGAVIPGVKVTLQNIDTKQTWTTETGDDGQFQFLALATGKYSMIVTHPNFKTHQVTNVEINNNQTISLDVNLQAELAVAWSGIVSLALPAPRPDPPGTKTIDQKLIQSLPH